jgi:hypothetical protein
MAFRRSDLQEAFFVPGTHAFRVWGYGTTDPLEEVLTPGYFAVARGLLRSGELIYVSTCPQERRGSRAESGEARMSGDGPGRRAGPGASRRVGAPGAGLRPPARLVENARRAGPVGAGRRGATGQARSGPPARQPEHAAGRAHDAMRRAGVVRPTDPARLRQSLSHFRDFPRPARISQWPATSHFVPFWCVL